MPLYLGHNKIQQLKVALVGLANQLNLQTKTVTPTESPQNIKYDTEYDGLDSVLVEPISSTYIGSAVTKKQAESYTPSTTEQSISAGQYLQGKQTILPVPTETKSISSNGTYSPSSGKFFSQVTVNVQQDEPALQEKTINPSETQQIVEADNGFVGMKKVIVNAISNLFVGSGIPRKSSSDLTTSGATVSVPSGYYENGASKSIASGSVAVGTPTVSSTGLITASATVSAGYVSSNPSNKTKQLTTQSAKTVTPNETEQTAVASGVYTTGTVKVGAIPSQYIIPSGSQTLTKNGNYDVTSLASVLVSVAGGSGGLPSGIDAFDFGDVVIGTAFTTSRQTFNHNLGVVPDFVFVYATANVAQTYSMLWAMRGSFLGYRSSAYNNFMCYHGNSTTNATMTNSNSTSYGVSNLTATTFQLASSSSSYYWRAGTYKYIAIKFS